MAVQLNKGSALGSLSMTPLIDVVFLLLIFFIVATRFADEERAMKLRQPFASEAKPLTAVAQEMFIDIDRNGKFYVNGEELDKAGLESRLAKVQADSPTRQVIIRADERADYGRVVYAVNLCNRYGMDHMASTRNTE